MTPNDFEGSGARPLPGGGRPKPSMRAQAPPKPKVRALYDYTAQDNDEISLVEGEILELIREGYFLINGSL
jgi:hypothetical protein